MTEITDERLAEIEARAAAATRGPWEAEHLHPFCSTVRTPQRHRVAMKIHSGDTVHNIPNYGTRAMMLADADFIAAARTDVPALIAALRSERARAEAAEAAANAALRALERAAEGSDTILRTFRARVEALEAKLAALDTTSPPGYTRVANSTPGDDDAELRQAQAEQAQAGQVT